MTEIEIHEPARAAHSPAEPRLHVENGIVAGVDARQHAHVLEQQGIVEKTWLLTTARRLSRAKHSN